MPKQDYEVRTRPTTTSQTTIKDVSCGGKRYNGGKGGKYGRGIEGCRSIAEHRPPRLSTGYVDIRKTASDKSVCSATMVIR